MHPSRALRYGVQATLPQSWANATDVNSANNVTFNILQLYSRCILAVMDVLYLVVWTEEEIVAVPAMGRFEFGECEASQVESDTMALTLSDYWLIRWKRVRGLRGLTASL